MKIFKKSVLRAFAVLLCVCMMLPCGVAFAKGDSVTAAFVGNTSHRNQQLKLYPTIVGEYLDARFFDRSVDIVNADPIDLDSADFLEVIKNSVLPQKPDMVFVELDVSKRYKSTSAEISAKLEAIVELIQDKSENPAIYFIYMPEENLYDGRAPFDKVAKYYGISVCDMFEVYKEKYAQKLWETYDFLNIGTIPGERGHGYIGEYLTNHLRNIDDLFAPPKQNEKTLFDIEKYLAYTPEAEAEEPIVPSSDGAVIYVAKSGSHKNSGTIDSPFGTLEQARNHIRHLKKKQGDDFKGATVYIREGLYNTGDGFRLTSEDSGTKEHPIVYKAYPGETVRLTNSVQLDPDGFKPVTDPNTLKRIPEVARDKVLQYDLRQSNTTASFFLTKLDTLSALNQVDTGRNFKLGNQLVVNGKNERRASWPDGGYAQVAAHQNQAKKGVAYKGVSGENWVTANHAYVWGTLSYGYFTDITKIESIDLPNKHIKLAANTGYTIFTGCIFSVTNLLEELSVPSEWYADPDTNILYYYPRRDIADSEILFSNNQNSVVIMDNTQYITLADLKIEAGGKDGVEINDGYGNLIDGCEIGNMNWNGVLINNTKNAPGPGKNGVINSHIYNTAVNGVYVKGGDTHTLTGGGDYVENCHFENYSTHMHSESAGVMPDGSVDTRVSHCNFHTDDSCAVFMGGNDDIFEYNEFYSISYDTDDYGAIYGDSRGAIRQGASIHHNYFHDIIFDFPRDGLTGLVAGIYTDSRRNWGADFHSNVFYRVTRPIFLADNRNQRVFGNLMLDTVGESAISSNNSVRENQINEYQERVEAAIKDGSFWTTSEGSAVDTLTTRAYRSWKDVTNFEKESMYAYYARYPWLEYYEDDDLMWAKYLILSSNAVFNSARNDLRMAEQIAPTTLKENNYVTNDAITPEMAGSDKRVDLVDKGMEVAAEKIPDFPVWDVRTAGILDEPKEIQDFEIVSPYNGQTQVDVASLVLTWDFASGADTYHVEVSSDPEFNQIEFETDTPKNWARVKNLQYGTKTYYWRVTASSTSEKFVGNIENLGGVHTFTSKKLQASDKTELGNKVTIANQTYDQMVEGTNGGEYPEGVKAEYKEAIDYATEVFESSRSTKTQVDAATTDMEKATKKALSKVNLEVIDLYETFSKPENWIHNSASTVEPEITDNGDSLKFKTSNGTFYGDKQLGTYHIAKMKAKFEFNNAPGKNYYTMIGLRVRDKAQYLYLNYSYVFLVTKDNIELQGFKQPSSNIGKFYMTIPNTFIEEGKEYDIEFAALPAKDGIGVRIILLVDGQVAYDYTDLNNYIEVGGMAAINSSSINCDFTLSKSSEPGSKIMEMLADPNSELNKIKE